MKVPNKRELQQICINQSSDIDFDEFKRLFKTCTAKPYLFLIVDVTFPSNNILRFQKNLLKEIQRVVKTIDEKIRDEKFQ